MATLCPHAHRLSRCNDGLCALNASAGRLSRTVVCQPAVPPIRSLQSPLQLRRVSTCQPAQAQSVAVDVADKPDTREKNHISWKSRWWPILPLDSLDPKIPQHVDLLDMSLMVWADSKGDWHCLEDKCPHRLAPLSEGRVEGDTLMCSYHGWTFNSTGACTNIPQLNHDPKAQAAACSSKRSWAKPYPTTSAYGLLWLWPEAGEAAAHRSSVEPPITLETRGRCKWFMRDLPVRYDTLMENLLDPSHVPFAHHGVGGSRYNPPELATGWNITGQSQVTAEGLVISGGRETRTFRAPFALTVVVGPMLGVQFLCVPTKPGWCRLIMDMPNALSAKEVLKWAKPLCPQGSPVFDAFYLNHVLDGDTYLLHVAERLMPVDKGIGLSAISRACYMPGKADMSVLAWRTWLSDHAGDIPTCMPEDAARMPPLTPKRQVLDRWEQHTKYCKDCRAAVALLDKALLACMAAGVVAVAAAVGQLVTAAYLVLGSGVPVIAGLGAVLPWGSVALCAAVVGLCMALHRGLVQLRDKFFYEEYTHANKD